MDIDEEELKHKKFEVLDLEAMSIEALYEYTLELELEIKRVEAEIDLKRNAREGAESIFKNERFSFNKL